MPGKYNKSVNNVFLLLVFALSKDIFSLVDILNYFAQYDVNTETETVLKYIRTLEKTGFEFKKANNKQYSLWSFPKKRNLSEEDTSVIYKMAQIIYEYLLGKNKLIMNKLLRLTNPDERKLFQQKIDILEENFEQNNRINVFDKYCKDAQRLQVTVKKNKKLEIEPYNIFVNKDGIFLNGINVSSKENILLNISDISSIVQMPVKNKFCMKNTEVLLKFTSRLSKAYTLKTKEEIIEKSDDYIVVKSFCYDKEKFFRNILRYMENCEIISPEWFRAEFAEYLENLYQMYDCADENNCYNLLNN